MELRQQLKDFRHLCAEIRELEERIVTLTSRSEMPAGAFDSIRVMRTRAKDPMGDLVAKYMDEIRKLTKLVQQRNHDREIILLTIAPLSAKKRRLIELRYFDGLSWADVATMLNYTETSCRRLNGQILHELTH